MSTQIAIRLDDDDLDALDREVREGRARSRSEALRRGIGHLRRQQRYRHDEEVLVDLARRQESVYPDLDGLLDLPHPALD
ncbi:MAG: ribbon-helix-helix protein, CopG family [Kineosporiaceae bacterium]